MDSIADFLVRKTALAPDGKQKFICWLQKADRAIFRAKNLFEIFSISILLHFRSFSRFRGFWLFSRSAKDSLIASFVDKDASTQ